MTTPELPNDFMAFMQKMWNPMSYPVPGMFMPTANVEDIEKKIAELKGVETWLTMNIGFHPDDGENAGNAESCAGFVCGGCPAR